MKHLQNYLHEVFVQSKIRGKMSVHNCYNTALQ